MKRLILTQQQLADAYAVPVKSQFISIFSDCPTVKKK